MSCLSMDRWIVTDADLRITIESYICVLRDCLLHTSSEQNCRDEINIQSCYVSIE